MKYVEVASGILAKNWNFQVTTDELKRPQDKSQIGNHKKEILLRRSVTSTEGFFGMKYKK